MGAVVDGMPLESPVALEELQAALDRRRPGRLSATTGRIEGDRAECSVAFSRAERSEHRSL